MRAALELQKAVYTALVGDAGLVLRLGADKIHDHAPPRIAFPYVTFGRAETSDRSTSTEDGEEHFLSLHVWSDAKGKREAMEIADLIRQQLHDKPLAVAGQALVLIRFTSLQARFDERAGVHQVSLSFHAVTEPDI